MINLILFSIGALFVIPTILRIVITLVGRGSAGLVHSVWSISRIAIGIGKYLLIPLAAFVLLAPDLWKSSLPGTSTLIGMVVLLVAALVLMFEMFKGLGSALAISFWAIVCVVIIGAFNLEKYIPKTTTLAQLQLKAASLASQQMKSQSVTSPAGRDGLEVSTFSLNQPVSRTKPVQFLDKDLVQIPSFNYATIQDSITSALPSSSDLFNTHDQSIQGLPAEAYFNSKGSRRQYYGMSMNSSSGSGAASFLDQPSEIFKKLLGK